MTKNSFGKRLLAARVDRGLSQAELAGLTGVAPAQVSRYESDKTKPRPHIVAKLAQALEVSEHWLGIGSETTPSGVVRVDFHPDGTGTLALARGSDLFARVQARAEEQGTTPEALLQEFFDRMLEEDVEENRVPEADAAIEDLKNRVAKLEAAQAELKKTARRNSKN